MNTYTLNTQRGSDHWLLSVLGPEPAIVNFGIRALGPAKARGRASMSPQSARELAKALVLAAERAERLDRQAA